MKRSSSSFLLDTILHLYVYIRTSTDVPLSEFPQRLTDTLFKRKSSLCYQNELFLWKRVSASRCGSSLNGTSVDVRMQTYRGISIPRRKKRTLGKHTHIPHYPVLHPHTVSMPHHSSYSTGRTTTKQKYTFYNKQDAIMVRPQKPHTYTHSYTITTRYNIYTRPLTQLSLFKANYKSRACIDVVSCGGSV